MASRSSKPYHFQRNTLLCIQFLVNRQLKIIARCAVKIKFQSEPEENKKNLILVVFWMKQDNSI